MSQPRGLLDRMEHSIRPRPRPRPRPRTASARPRPSLRKVAEAIDEYNDSIRLCAATPPRSSRCIERQSQLGYGVRHQRRGRVRPVGGLPRRRGPHRHGVDRHALPSPQERGPGPAAPGQGPLGPAGGRGGLEARRHRGGPHRRPAPGQELGDQRAALPATRRSWSTPASRSSSPSSPTWWTTGSSAPTPTAPTRPPRPKGSAGTPTWSRAPSAMSARCALGPSTGPLSPKSSSASKRSSSRPTGREAKERLGRDPHADELCRTPAQRRADAMVEMAVRSASSPPGAKKPKPLFSVLVGFETLAERISQIENGPVVTPGSLLEWLDRAEFERIVWLPTNRIECSKYREVLHRGHQTSHRGARPPVPARVLRPTGRVVRHRPHQALERGRADRAGQCAGPVRPAQSRALRTAPARGTT